MIQYDSKIWADSRKIDEVASVEDFNTLDNTLNHN